MYRKIVPPKVENKLGGFIYQDFWNDDKEFLLFISKEEQSKLIRFLHQRYNHQTTGAFQL